MNFTNSSSLKPSTISSEVEFTVKQIIIPFLCLAGILGHLLSVSVFLQKSLRSQFTIILCALGLSDSVFLLGRFLIFGIYETEDHSPVYIPSVTFCGNILNIG